MSLDINNPYIRTKVLTASPEQLRMMLIEGAIRFTRQGREGLERKDFEAVYDGFSQAKAIVMELMNALKPELAPELCKNVGALYTFIYRTLIEASFEKSMEKADEALRLLEYERETWAMVIERIASERDTGAPAAAAAPTAPAGVTAAPAGEYRPLSVEG